MATSYLEVYKRAITEIQDPHLKRLYTTNILLFTQVMGNFMTNAISLFVNPPKVRERLAKKKSPYEYKETFAGDSSRTSFSLSTIIDPADVPNMIFMTKLDDKAIEVEYNPQENAVVFPFVMQVGEYATVSMYYVGGFELDLYDEEISLLANWLMVCWSEYVQNNKLDIDRLLGDTDFHLTSNGPTTTSKTNWFIVNRETATKRMSNYAWDCWRSGRYK